MKINWEKLENRLNEVQNKCSARCFNMNDVKQFVEKLQKKRMEFLNSPDLLERKYFKKVTGTMYYHVPNSYKWKAESTYVYGYITRHGRIKIEITRAGTDRRPYGGYVESIEPVFA